MMRLNPVVPPSESSTYFDGSNDTPSYKRVIAEPFSHTRGSELQQSAETVQSSFTSSPIKTHDVVPKVAVAAENRQYTISQLMQIVQNWEL